MAYVSRIGIYVPKNVIIIPAIREAYEKHAEAVILSALKKYSGDKSKAARALGVSRTTLMMWLAKNHPETIQKIIPGASDEVPIRNHQCMAI